MTKIILSGHINSHQTIGTLLAILSGILYGSLGYLGTTQLNSHFSVYDVLFWRFFLAGILLTPFIFKRSQTEKALLKNFLLIFFIGGGFYGLSTLLYFWSAAEIGTGISMVIFFTFPIFVTFLSWAIDNHHFNRSTYISILLTCIGMVLLAGNIGSNFFCKEALWGLGSGFSYALYVFTSKKIKISPLKVTVFVCLGSAFTIWLVGSCALQTFYLPSLEASWLHVISMALIATAIPILLFLEAMKRVCATKASLLAVFEPITAVIIGIMLLGENLTLIQVMGIGVLLIGATLANYEQ